VHFPVVVAVDDPEIEGTGDDLSTWRSLLTRDLLQLVRWVAGGFEKGSVGTGFGIGKGIEESAYVTSGMCVVRYDGGARSRRVCCRQV